MININKITKTYGKRTLFQDFSYSFPNTGMYAILGDSGSGKSTILNLISGIDLDYKGSIDIDGVNLKNLSKSQILDFRLKKIGYVFQNFNLLNLETALNNVLLPVDTICSEKKRLKKQRALDALNLVGLGAKKNSQINKLSGGEKQRVAIARSIINKPKVILCDEPTGALDEKNSALIFNLLKQISLTTLVIIATHDAQEIVKYADKILYLKDEKFSFEILNNECKKKEILLLDFKKQKITPKVTNSFKISYAFQKIKAKKWRSLIVNFLLSLSLTGVGLSLILSQSVSQKVEDAFTTMLNGNQIIINRRNELENSFTNVYSSPYKNVDEINNKYKYLTDGIGVNYLVNFENFFKDENDFYVQGKSKLIPINSLSTRNINDFSWIESGDSKICYPISYETLDDDQVILGISYEDMVSICFQLQIQRNYTSLGHYIYENGLNLCLKVRNNSWQYDDQQILSVVAITESKNTVFYHTNILWNEVFFEDMMRLPSDDDEDHEFPWEMYKIYYLKTKEDASLFLNESFYDSELYDFVFERANSDYNPVLCKPGEVCDEKRVYIYVADKYAIDPEIIKKVANNNSYYFTSDFGYASYASNLFSGFSKNVFVSLNHDKICNAIDADTQLNDEANIQIDLPKGVVQGNFLNAMSGGLKFSTKTGELLYGRLPQNINEIVVSKGLGKQLDEKTYGLGKYMEIAGEIEEYRDKSGRLIKEYNTAKTIIVGVTDDEKNYVYQNPDWTISFFRDKLGVSNFYLMPRSIVFEFDSEKEAEESYVQMQSVINEYKISNPLDDLKVNIDSTLEYANTILISFSVLATLISVLLLGTVMMLNIIESKEEVNLLNCLGFKKKDINSVFTNQAIVQGLISFVISAVELVVVDIVLSYILGDYLNVGFQFNLNLKPILLVFGIAIILPFFISKIMLLYLTRRKINKKM